MSAGGELLVVGTPADAEAGTAQGAAYVYAFTDAGWREQIKLVPGDADAHTDFGMLFGSSVDTDGHSIVVGAVADRGLHGETHVGSAYVYEHTAGTRTESTELKVRPADAHAEQWFGYSTAVRGERLFVSAPRDDEARPQGGAVYVFRRRAAGFVQVQKVMPPDPNHVFFFGGQLAAAGDTLLVNGAQDPSGTADWEHVHWVVYVYELRANAYRLTQTLAPDDSQSADYFGWSMALDGQQDGQQDGRQAVIGAQGHDGVAPNEGAAYVFRRDARGFRQVQTLSGAPHEWGSMAGGAVAMQGGLLAVARTNQGLSAMAPARPGFAAPGQVDVYRQTSASDVWQYVRTLDAPDSHGQADGLGRSVAVTHGEVLGGAIRARQAAYAYAPGAVYAFACAAAVSDAGSP